MSALRALLQKCARPLPTLADYGAVAEAYAQGNLDHDVSQNIEAMLKPLADRPAPLDVLDVCWHRAATYSRFKLVDTASGPRWRSRILRHVTGTVWVRSLAAGPGVAGLAAAPFDAVFCNASFDLPRVALRALSRH